MIQYIADAFTDRLVSRCFYPKLNVPEDPVTGSAHTYLTPFWAGKLGKTEMAPNNSLHAAVYCG